jgi:hypothetical protein
MSAAVHGCSLVLAHAPDLVRHGSKPTRENAAEQIAPRLRAFEDALGYPPHQVFLGNLPPGALWEIGRPWWGSPAEPKREGPFGVFVDEEELYRRMEAADQFQLLKLDGREAADGSLPIYRNGDRAGVMLRAHDLDESLSASVLLENLACKATGALALEHLLGRTSFPADDLQYVIGCGEEAVGDRYQRGGGNLGKAIAEQAGCRTASGSDVKAFCAGPIHAVVMAASLVSAGVYDHVAVVAGGSLAKLGMKFAGALRHDIPVLEDVLAGLAVLIGPPGNGAPVLRLDAVGRCSRISSSRRSKAWAAGSSTSSASPRSCTIPRSPSRPGPGTSRSGTTGSWVRSPSSAASSSVKCWTPSSATTVCLGSRPLRVT